MLLNTVRITLWLFTLPLVWWLAGSAPSQAAEPPKLAVVIVVDQFRYDYLLRYRDQYLPARGSDGRVGGFRLLMEQGADFKDARYNHYPLFTGPGHAVVLTGANPELTGIAGNEWFDRATGVVARHPVHLRHACAPVAARSGSAARRVLPVRPPHRPGAGACGAPRHGAAERLRRGNDRGSG